MRSIKYALTALMLFGLTACDLSNEALLGQKGHLADETQNRASNERVPTRCQVDLKWRESTWNPAGLQDWIMGVTVLSQSDYEQSIPDGMELVGGLEILLKDYGATRVQLVYKRQFVEARRPVECKEMKETAAPGYQLFQCFLVVPQNDLSTKNSNAVAYGFDELTLGSQSGFSKYSRNMEEIDIRCEELTTTVKLRGASHFEFPALGNAAEFFPRYTQSF